VRTHGSESDDLFSPTNLPYGVFRMPGSTGSPHVGVAIHDRVLDLAELFPGPDGDPFRTGSLNAFLATGPERWRSVRETLLELLDGRDARRKLAAHMRPRSGVELLLPVEIGDYVDFYASRHHAENMGRIFRPGGDPLPANWLHLPMGYHGRAGTVVVSGTPVRRPIGQRKGPSGPDFAPSTCLDIEAEVGFIVGTNSVPGTPLRADDFHDVVFGVVLINDWSARDIQAWEYQPLGPFLGKSFATSMSPWVVPLAALDQAMLPAPTQHPEPLPYLREQRSSLLDINIEVLLNGHVIAEPAFRDMYWTPGQQLAHMTANGAHVRTGDLYASGTVSGPERHQRGSLIELTWNGTEPLVLEDHMVRAFLADGDTITIRASAPAPGGGRLGFGAVTGTISSRPG
jgi:fumarylacetoacetase